MDILGRIRKTAERCPDRAAVICGEKKLTYGRLWEDSDLLARHLAALLPDPVPLAVYGHKDPRMIVCFLACVKAGHAYCPIDSSVPEERVRDILRQLPDGVVLAPEYGEADPLLSGIDGKQVLGKDRLSALLQNQSADVRTLPVPSPVREDDTWYIIFTSGSTGQPKGVQITASCLSHFLGWSESLIPQTDDAAVFLNQAPFSFDLSIMDLYTSLVSGGTLFCLTKATQGDYGLLMRALGGSGVGVWVSTPSFAQMCLSEKQFSAGLLPKLNTFLFCGETLDNRLAARLAARFPAAVIYNTYGPTESTVAVTGTVITKEMTESGKALPVGRPKPGTRIEIRDKEGRKLPDGQKGEIVILGDTVSTGYYRQKELSEKAFFTDAAGTPQAVRGYHTGDEGWLKDGMLHYGGRMDFQVKLHGYRIELEDIENNIRRLPGVCQAAVIPNFRQGKVSSLTAFVVPETFPEDSKDFAEGLKEALTRILPAYMIPKKICVIREIPMTGNGKTDRKALGGMKA